MSAIVSAGTGNESGFPPHTRARRHLTGVQDPLRAVTGLVDADRQIDPTRGQDPEQGRDLFGGFGPHHRDRVAGADSVRTQRRSQRQRLAAQLGVGEITGTGKYGRRLRLQLEHGGRSRRATPLRWGQRIGC